MKTLSFLDIDLLVDFNENLMRSKTLRNDCARRLATIINKSSNTNNFTRIKSLCYKIIHLDVWVTFSFTGRASKYGSPSKNAFKDFVVSYFKFY